MIIVEQDEKTIVNFNDVTKIYITSPIEINDGEFEIMAENEWITQILGYYKTEERAKEVLEEITDMYCRCNSEYGSIGYVRNRVYKMPKE